MQPSTPPATVSLGDLQLSPYAFAIVERWQRASYEIRVLLDEAESSSLRAMLVRPFPSYFPVQISGVIDTPTLMRLGAPTWSKHPQGFKFHLILVTQAGDDRNPQGALIPWEPQVREFVARHQSLLENLIEMLQAKGQLSAAEVEGLHLQADATWRSHQLDFFEVEDIDA